MVENSPEEEKSEEKARSGDILGIIKKIFVEHPVAASISTVLSLGFGVTLSMPVWYTSETSQMRERYQQLQAQYADTDGDGYISREEKVDFRRDLFRNRGVVSYNHLTCPLVEEGQLAQCLKDEFPVWRYSSTGEEVPAATILTWMNEYTPTRR